MTAPWPNVLLSKLPCAWSALWVMSTALSKARCVAGAVKGTYRDAIQPLEVVKRQAPTSREPDETERPVNSSFEYRRPKPQAVR